MEFRILGPLEVRGDGAVADLGHAKQRSVLGVLLLHTNEVVSRDRLIDELWGERPPPTATKLVQLYLSHLRRQLREVEIEGVLRTRAPGYVADVEDESLDAARFERLTTEARVLRLQNRVEAAAKAYRQALALWRGAALADLDFQSFARNEVERLNEARLDALTERIECELDLGRHAGLIGELEGLVARHPLRERLLEQLMLALYRSGRQGEALAVYQKLRRALRDKLGLEPTPELRRLEQAILRHDESLRREGPSSADTLPTGTVTLLFTDIEGSTLLLRELGESFVEVLNNQRRVLRSVFEKYGGCEVDIQGDSFLVVFSSATNGAMAALEAQRLLADEPMRVRIALHTGEPERGEHGYVGLDVVRGARLCAAAHGGQVLVSASTASRLDLELRDLGEHRFKDSAEPERVFQLGERDYPPLRSLRNVRLPVPATPFLGRERELEEVVKLLTRGDVRLLTLLGPGGTGKTRLALQAAAEASERYPDGASWVALAPLRDPALILSSVAQALDLKERPDRELEEVLAAELRGKRLLLVLDNAEHLLPDAAGPIVSLRAASGVMLLVTSRERLQLNGECVYRVPTLSERESIEFFVARARALNPAFKADGSVRQLCAGLDNLPLALELAAGRTVLLTPEQLLQRLSQRLDLLKGGRDAEPRQQTLRATIDWSYELLSSEEQRLLRELSVFAGGCSYEAAEEVCGAEPDSLQSLLEKSLLRRRDSAAGPGYLMLETIREYAAERLELSGDLAAVRLRHAQWCCNLAERLCGTPGFPGEGASGLEADYDNVRAAIAWAWRSGNVEHALRLCATFRFWMTRGLFRDALAWLQNAGPRIPLASPSVQLQALKVAGMITFFIAAQPEKAAYYWQRALHVAEELGETGESEWIEDRRAMLRAETGDVDSVLRHFDARVKCHQASRDRHGEANALQNMGDVLRDLGRFEQAEAALTAAAAIYREHGHELGLANNIHSLADLALDRGEVAPALRLYLDSLALNQRLGEQRGIVYTLAGIACILAMRKQETAATIWGAVCAAEDALGFRMVPGERRRYESHLASLEGTEAWSAGRLLRLEEAIALAPR